MLRTYNLLALIVLCFVTGNAFSYEGWSSYHRVNKDTTLYQFCQQDGAFVRSNGNIAVVWEDVKNGIPAFIYLRELDMTNCDSSDWSDTMQMSNTASPGHQGDQHAIVIENDSRLLTGYYFFKHIPDSLFFCCSYIDTSANPDTIVTLYRNGYVTTIDRDSWECAAANDYTTADTITIFVWIEKRGSNYQLRYTDYEDGVWNNNTRWFEPNDSVNITAQPSMATDSDGNIHMVFFRDASSDITGDICYSEYIEEYDQWTDPIYLSDTTETCRYPRIHYSESNDSLYASWCEHDGSNNYDLKYKAWAVNGQPPGNATTLVDDSKFQTSLNISSTSEGRFMAVWIDTSSSHQFGMYKTKESGSSWSSNGIFFKDVNNFVVFPQPLVAEDDSTFHIIGTITSGAPSDVYYWQYDKNITDSNGTSFLPGDVNNDGVLTGGDVSYLLNYFFGGGPPPPDPINRADANGDCVITGPDITYLVNFFTSGGLKPVWGLFCNGCGH